jgi:DNA replication and repair protein RecF
MISKLPCVLFSHSDIEFARGSPERRRWFFDQLISLYDLEYIDSLRKYKKILRARNLELKNRRGDLLEYLDTQLISQGFEIIKKREKAILELSLVFMDLYKAISGISELINIVYYPSWKKGISQEKLETQLKEKRRQEFQYAVTLSGPHRDRIEYEIDARSYSKTASTGQLRLLSLTLRLAQAIYYTKKTGRKPILLLDDVLLELDPQKRMKFIATLPEYDQAFFTFLPGEPLESYRSKETIIYCVANGKFTHKESK